MLQLFKREQHPCWVEALHPSSVEATGLMSELPPFPHGVAVIRFR